MEKMTFMQLREARNKANEKLGDLYMNARTVSSPPKRKSKWNISRRKGAVIPRLQNSRYVDTHNNYQYG